MNIENPLEQVRQEQNPEQPKQKETTDDEKDPSRRDFLKKAAKFAAGAAAFSLAGQGLSPETASAKEKKAAPKPETSAEEKIANPVLSPEQIKEIEKIGGKIEFNQDGVLILYLYQPGSAPNYSLKQRELEKVVNSIDESKYRSSSGGESHPREGSWMRWFAIHRSLSVPNSYRDLLPGTVSSLLSDSNFKKDDIEKKYGAIIEKNEGNFVLLLQKNAEIRRPGNIIEDLKKIFDAEHYSVKNVASENETRTLVINKAKLKEKPVEQLIFEEKIAPVLSPEQIKEIEKMGGKIECNQDGALVISQPDSAPVYLKDTLIRAVDLSKYNFTAQAGGWHGQNTRWYITDKSLTVERNFPAFGTVSSRLPGSGIEEKYGAEIEENMGDFVSIFQKNEEISQHGNIRDKYHFDSEYFSSKYAESENGIRIFIMNAHKLKEKLFREKLEERFLKEKMEKLKEKSFKNT